MIRSTFASFVTAQTGLNASQRALDVVGQNMTNVNTDGYTRQRLDLLSLSSGGYTNRYSFLPSNDVGQGVFQNGINQIRDPFLDVRFRREHAKLGEAEAEYSTLTDIEKVYNELTVDGLGKGLSNFYSQLQSLSYNTGDSGFDGIARSSADYLCKLFNSYSKQLAQVREQETYQLERIDIPRVNTILESISSINKSIREDQTYGNPSLELKDQRNLLLDELSQYMKIDVQYNPVEIAEGIVVEDVSVKLRTEDVPPQFVDLMFNKDYVTFSAEADPLTGSVKVSVSNDGGVTTEDVTAKLQSGVIKGVLDMLNKSGPFDSPVSDTRGIGYYEKTLDLMASKFAEEFNRANAYMDPNNPGSFLDDHPLFTNIEDDSENGITAANISVSQGWANSSYGISVTWRDMPEDNSGANDNVLNMIKLFDEKLSFDAASGTSVFSGTFQEFHREVTNTLALDTDGTSKLMKNFTSIVNGVVDLRDGVSGVNLDEEGINLLRFQKSYNAAARYMTTLDEALDKLINGTGIVGR